MAGQLAGPEQFLNDDAVIWKSNQIFNKSDRKGDTSREASPFRFSGVRSVVSRFLRRTSQAGRYHPVSSCASAFQVYWASLVALLR